jgi:hypothetical protein
MKFKIGDKVLIRKDSRFYGDPNSNPKDTYGYIHSLKYSIIVKWENGMRNGYSGRDLKLVLEKCKIQTFDHLKKYLFIISIDRKVNVACSLKNITTENKQIPDKFSDKLFRLNKKFNLKDIYVEYNRDHTIKRMIINPKDDYFESLKSEYYSLLEKDKTSA